MPGRKTFDAQGTQDVAGKLYSFAKGISRQPRQEGVEARAVDDSWAQGVVVASDFRDEMRDDAMTWGFLHVWIATESQVEGIHYNYNTEIFT